MMKRFLNILWLGVVVFFLSACQKYLEVQSNYGLAVPNSLDDLHRLLDDSQNMNLKLPAFGEASADNY
jgi:hypothetical protein